MLALLSGKQDLLGEDRIRSQDRDKALAGKSTLNRLELTPEDANAESRYKKIVARPEAMDDLLVNCFLESYATAPYWIVLDVDATDDPLHGHQEGRYFHGYYGHYCYLPLYLFCGEQLLCARLRSADQEPAAGTTEASWSGSLGGFARLGRRFGLYCVETVGSAAKRSWLGVKSREWSMCWVGQERATETGSSG